MKITVFFVVVFVKIILGLLNFHAYPVCDQNLTWHSDSSSALFELPNSDNKECSKHEA